MVTRLYSGFCKGHFQREFVRQVNVICDAIIGRVLPTFAGIAQEANGVADDEYERHRSLPASEDTDWDMAHAAEWAEEAGQAYFDALWCARQAILNLAVAALYYLPEQQLLFYHPNQLLREGEDHDVSKVTMREFKRRLNEAGTNIEVLPCWPKIDELRLVASSVKHAEGGSSRALRELGPDLFVHPVQSDDGRESIIPAPCLELPLGGEDFGTPEEE